MDTVIEHCTLFTSRFPASSVPRTKVDQNLSDPHPEPTPPPTPPPLEVRDLTIGGALKRKDYCDTATGYPNFLLLTSFVVYLSFV